MMLRLYSTSPFLLSTVVLTVVLYKYYPYSFYHSHVSQCQFNEWGEFTRIPITVSQFTASSLYKPMYL
jgi:hypothetical protein